MAFAAQKTTLIHTLGFQSVYPSILLYLQVDQLPDYKRLERAVKQLEKIIPQLACRYDYETNCFYPVSEAIIQPLRSTENPYDYPLDFLKHTQLKIYVRPQPDYAELFLIGSHLLTDAAGFKQLAYALVKLYNEPTAILGENQLDIMDVYGQFQSSTLPITREDITGTPLTLEFSEPETTAYKMAQQICLDEVTFEQLHHLTRQKGFTLNDSLLGAYMRFLKRHNPAAKQIQLACPTDTRQFLANPTGLRIGNYTARYNPTVAIESGESFWKSVAKVHQEMLVLKQNAEFYESVQPLFAQPAQTIAEMRAALRSTYHPRSIAYTNLMKIDADQLSFADIQLFDAWMSGAFRQVPNFQVCFSTFRKHLNLVCTVSGDQQNQQTAKKYLQAIKAELIAGLEE